MGRYQHEFRRSLAGPDQFRRDAAGLIDWYTEPSVVPDRSNPPFYRWLTGGMRSTGEMVPSTIGDPAARDALRPLLHGG